MTTDEIIELVIGIIVVGVLSFTSINQKSRVSEWLVFAVTDSEKELGKKTGQLKLRLVYAWFIEKFPILSAIIPFVLFSKWVNKALEIMKAMKETNSNVAAYIESRSKPTEVKISADSTIATSVVATLEGGTTNENNIQKQSEPLQRT